MTVKTITGCNRLFSAKTPNPLVSMIRLSDTTEISQVLQFGFFTVLSASFRTQEMRLQRRNTDLPATGKNRYTGDMEA